MRKIMRLLLAGYHRGVSPVLPNACRFYPSCSVYAAQAVEKYGVAKGLWLGLRRLTRCNPWSLGGYDPPV
jgi:putative membrane protein insertion efficiency factor